MSDVSVVLPTNGDPLTERALQSVRRQRLAPAEVIVIGPEISPFHRALNAGAARVRTRFFLHVDADMILDRDCIALLRRLMNDGVGMVQGCLRDPLCGKIAGIRLVRTACWAANPYRESIAPETRFWQEIAERGWTFVNALHYSYGDPKTWHTCGDHCPTYTALYTLWKFRISGARYREIGRPDLLMRLAEQFLHSRHPAALTALIALTHGVLCFVGKSEDDLPPQMRDAEYDVLESFLGRPCSSEPRVRLTTSSDPAALFRQCRQLGAEIGRSGDVNQFRASVRALEELSPVLRLVGLCGVSHGLFQPLAGEDSLTSELGVLDELLAERPPRPIATVGGAAQG